MLAELFSPEELESLIAALNGASAESYGTACLLTAGIYSAADVKDKSIAAAIENNLGQAYSYTSRVINFKNYGACSSRQRTVVIGVSKDYADEVSPLELYPDLVKERTLREVIGDLKPLKEFGEIDENDIYHSFRPYIPYVLRG